MLILFVVNADSKLVRGSLSKFCANLLELIPQTIIDICGGIFRRRSRPSHLCFSLRLMLHHDLVEHLVQEMVEEGVLDCFGAGHCLLLLLYKLQSAWLGYVGLVDADQCLFTLTINLTKMIL